MIPQDLPAREAALDPAASVCVSAPAGSGKTGLLVHRFLVLLARVEQPEHVVAITFTRKAAAEMRARVLDAIEAASGSDADLSAHARGLRDAARAVLKRDAAQDWGLRDNPARLTIQTIDSFCGEITRQMPVASRAGGAIAPDDDCSRLYGDAIERFLRDTLTANNARARTDMETLLLHLDNRWEAASELLQALLQRREQWQPLLGARGLDTDQRSLLRQALARVTEHRLAQLRSRLSAQLPALEDLTRWRHEQAADFPPFERGSGDPAIWQALAEALLTKNGDWRRSVNRNQGFPPGKGEAAERKAEFIELLRTLEAEDGDGALRRALSDILLLPGGSSHDEHWEVLAALSRLLPRLAAELLLVFREHGVVDHGQVALAALAALGDDDSPTDIALRLDHRIEHLLVDEFQDTSSLQFELLRRLTRGWVEHNAQFPGHCRTLLIVGDPMQSIYGFREANVGLFIRARDEGIGDLTLKPLELTVNFRSTATLVDWSNRHFADAFPRHDDPELGAVAFAPATAARSPGAEPVLKLFSGEDSLATRAAEVDALCNAVEAELRSHPDTTLAILGRSRSALRPFIAELRFRGVALQARDLDALGERALIRDLLTLTTVLFDRSDRYPWLALLRTPSVALGKQELWFMARHAPVAAALAPLLKDSMDDARAALSDASLDRLMQLQAVLDWADHYRDRLALRVWVEETWLRLGAAGALRDDGEAQDALQFFRLLEQLELEQGTPTIGDIERALASLYAAPGEDSARLQVMTLHKAKGLEFDAVFIPALGKATRSEQKPLLLWEELALPGQESTVLLDVRGATGKTEGGRLYEFLRAHRGHKQDFEATRLFYVGCTRAAARLWLSATLPWNTRENGPGAPTRGSLLSRLDVDIETLPVEVIAGEGDAEEFRVPYRRIVAPWTPGAAIAQRSPSSATPLMPSTPADAGAGIASAENRRARALGTAVHRVLEALIEREAIPEFLDDALGRLLRVSLLENGADRPALDTLCRTGEERLNRALKDPWLRWSLSRERPDRSAELPLTAVVDGVAKSLVLDYVFRDEATGEFWVVDYKTAELPPGGDPDSFIAVQEARYRDQIESYRHALRSHAAAPVRCALYFTALAKHHEITKQSAES